MLKKIFLYSITTSLIAGFLILQFNFSKQYTKQNNVTFSSEYMKDLNVTDYEKNGCIKNIIHANYWEYTPETKNSVIYAPKLILAKKNTTWNISSKYATAFHTASSSKISHILLENNVVVIKKSDDDSPTTLTTEYLYYYPEHEHAETNAFVAVENTEHKITGTGAIANLKNNIFKVINNVTSKFKK